MAEQSPFNPSKSLWDLMPAQAAPLSNHTPQLFRMPLPSGNNYQVTDDDRARGLAQLKEKMLRSMGVDYTTHGVFDDSPTQEQVKRGSFYGGTGLFDYFHGLNSEMEQKQSRGDPGIDYPFSYLFPGTAVGPVRGI